MKITPTTPVATPTPNTYTIHINTMIGDADGYDLLNIAGFREGHDEALLESLITTLTAMKETFPHGRGGGFEYGYSKKVPSFKTWFEDPNRTDEAQAFLERTNQTLMYWPFEPYDHYEGHGEQTLTTWTVTYYDENADAWHTEVILP